MRPSSKKEITTLRLTSNNMPLFGFARFIYPDELIGHGKILNRMIQLASGSRREEQWAEIGIDKDDLIILEGKNELRLSRTSDFSIRICFENIEAMKLLSERAGWNQTLEDLVHYTKLDPAGNFIAGYNDGKHFIPLGTGAVFPVGTDTSWISMILVHPEVRRQGIASAIMGRCITHARLSSGKPVVGLDATPEGSNVYYALGFKDAYKLWRCRVRLKDKWLSSSGLVDHEPIRNIKEIASFLTRTAYFNRRPILDILLHLPGSVSYMAKSDETVEGIIFSRPGRRHPSIGPLLAANKSIASGLLQQTLRHWNDLGFEEVFMDIPEQKLDTSTQSLKTTDLAGHWMENTLIPGCKVSLVRPFIRMYQLIEPGNLWESDPDFLKDADQEEIFKASMKRSTASFEATIKSMEIERDITLPHLYAIGGPEIG